MNYTKTVRFYPDFSEARVCAHCQWGDMRTRFEDK